MDPIANKIEQLKIATEILALWDRCSLDGQLSVEQARECADLANRLAELVDALAGWEGWHSLTPMKGR